MSTPIKLMSQNKVNINPIKLVTQNKVNVTTIKLMSQSKVNINSHQTDESKQGKCQPPTN